MYIKEKCIHSCFLLLFWLAIVLVGQACEVPNKEQKEQKNSDTLVNRPADTIPTAMQMPDTSLITYADSMDCNFDQNLQTDDFLKKTSVVQQYIWNKETKIAYGRLTNGDSLIASRGGCYSFGQKVRLISKNKLPALNQTKDWLMIAKNLSKDFFEPEFGKVLRQAIADSSYEMSRESGSLKIEFPAAKYKGMWLIIDKKANRIEYELGYYTEKKI